MSDSARNQRVDEAIAAYLQAEEAGTPLDREAFLSAHAEVRAELESFLSARLMLQRHAPIDEAATVPPSSAPVASMEVVRYFGDYEVIEELARGGMGVVFRARQVSLNRVVALKMILSGSLAGLDDVRRFRTEAEAAANLDHPNVCPIYEVGEHQGQQYYSMKLIAGGSMAGRMTHLVQHPREAAELLAKVADAVHHAHVRGILHRDLKPANVLLDEAGVPYVTDFGLARRVEGDSGLTQTGAIVGTPAYMAPEQAQARKDLTPACDVYALGAMLYECLTGQVPFSGPSPLDVVMQVVDRAPVPPRQINGRVPRDLETICLKCLEKEPGRRYSSAQALADDLRRWLKGEPIVARPAGNVERAVKWVRRKPAVAGMWGFAAVLSVAGLVSVWADSSVALLVVLAMMWVGALLLFFQRLWATRMTKEERREKELREEEERREKVLREEEERSLGEGAAKKLDRKAALSATAPFAEVSDSIVSLLRMGILYLLVSVGTVGSFFLVLSLLIKTNILSKEAARVPIYCVVVGLLSSAYPILISCMSRRSKNRALTIFKERQALAETEEELAQLEADRRSTEAVYACRSNFRTWAFSFGGVAISHVIIWIWLRASNEQFSFFSIGPEMVIVGLLLGILSDCIVFTVRARRVMRARACEKQPSSLKLTRINESVARRTLAVSQRNLKEIKKLELFNTLPHKLGYRGLVLLGIVFGSLGFTFRLWMLLPEDAMSQAGILVTGLLLGSFLGGLFGATLVTFARPGLFAMVALLVYHGFFDSHHLREFETKHMECVQWAAPAALASFLVGHLLLRRGEKVGAKFGVYLLCFSIVAACLGLAFLLFSYGGQLGLLFGGVAGRGVAEWFGHCFGILLVLYVLPYRPTGVDPRGSDAQEKTSLLLSITSTKDEAPNYWSLPWRVVFFVYLAIFCAVWSIPFWAKWRDGAVATMNDDRSVSRADWDKMDLKIDLKAHGGPPSVRALAFAPDGRHLLTACNDRTLRLWHVETGMEVRRLKYRGAVAQSVALSPDGSRALSGHRDGSVRVWDMENLEELRRLDQHRDVVTGVAFAPDSRTAFTCSLDKTVRRWDATTGRHLGVCRGRLPFLGLMGLQDSFTVRARAGVGNSIVQWPRQDKR